MHPTQVPPQSVPSTHCNRTIGLALRLALAAAARGQWHNFKTLKQLRWDCSGCQEVSVHTARGGSTWQIDGQLTSSSFEAVSNFVLACWCRADILKAQLAFTVSVLAARATVPHQGVGVRNASQRNRCRKREPRRGQETPPMLLPCAHVEAFCKSHSSPGRGELQTRLGECSRPEPLRMHWPAAGQLLRLTSPRRALPSASPALSPQSGPVHALPCLQLSGASRCGFTASC